MYLWRKVAAPPWLNAHEARLQTRSRGQLAIIAKPGAKRLQAEVACGSRAQAQHLLRDFGGRIEKLPRNWVRRFARQARIEPLKIGKRLVVVSSRSCGVRPARCAGALGKAPLLVIPTGPAFGTGNHPTTAMSLRLLEQITRGWKPGWSLVDLGTGSGILALAAKRFGAKRVLAVDLDPTAISTAKTNARLNKIDKVDFQLGDVRRWKPARKIGIVTANLFSEILIRIMPKLKRSNWLILSGVLRAQEKEFLRTLRRSKIDIVHVRRRGKWVAVLAKTI
jgi:ribosomal protein L11 methyltransferase